MKKPALINLALAAGTLLAPVARATAIERDASAQIILQEGRTVLIYPTNGTFTVTEPGEVELLLVGGGGGGGKNNGQYTGSGGGGAGGVVTNTVTLQAGTYSVVVGAGGAVATKGGDTMLSLGGETIFTAYGGGAGVDSATRLGAVHNGASGGGGQTISSANTTPVSGGSALYCDAPASNLGHDGGSSSSNQYGAGGGGGAGAAGASGSGSAPGAGGNGVEVPLISSGDAFWYGGGGAGTRGDGTQKAKGGKGGGGDSGKAGEDGKGGGGAGHARGGSGVVVLAFSRTEEPPVKDGWFECEGGDEVLTNVTAAGSEEIRIFRNSGTLTVLRGRGTMEVLAVGGGGGGGMRYNASAGAGGGGAGGVVHYTNFVAVAGTYAITIGAGGGISTNGFATSGLGITAYGGGAGDNSTWYGLRPAVDGVTKDGASGGGGAIHDGAKSSTIAGGAAIYGSYMNLGNPGGTAPAADHLYGPAGGGGAGSPGHDGVGAQPGAGGDGYECAITGTATFYGGGGAGHRADGNRPAQGGLGGGGGAGAAGEDGKGGGGSGLAAGGSGVFIVRYRLKPTATTIVFR